MKANESHYEAAIEIYGKSGTASVFEYAGAIGVDEFSCCDPCETDTPDCKVNEEIICLVCGSIK